MREPKNKFKLNLNKNSSQRLLSKKPKVKWEVHNNQNILPLRSKNKLQKQIYNYKNRIPNKNRNFNFNMQRLIISKQTNKDMMRQY